MMVKGAKAKTVDGKGEVFIGRIKTGKLKGAYAFKYRRNGKTTIQFALSDDAARITLSLLALALAPDKAKA